MTETVLIQPLPHNCSPMTQKTANLTQDGTESPGKNEDGEALILKVIKPEPSDTDTHNAGCKLNIAVQANDYDIERKCSGLPARRRFIPAKFRDFHDPNDLPGDDPRDEDFIPRHCERVALKIRRVGRPQGRGRGRVKQEHPYGRQVWGEVGNLTDLQQSTGDNSENVKTDPTNESIVFENATTTGNKCHIEGCLLTFGNEGLLSKHLKIVHNGDTASRRGRPPSGVPLAPKLFRCGACGKHFSQRGNLRTHMGTHTNDRPFTCDVEGCEKRFRSKESVRRHKLAHLGIKLFECPDCQEKFASAVTLKEHMDRHTDTKPYKCDECGKRFRQLSCFHRHVVTHSNETPFSCGVCGRKFSLNVYLKSHMRMHTGEKPFECKTCLKSFAHLSDLNRHKIIHSGEKPYACDICWQRFSDPSSRRRHVREHNGIKSHRCQLCGDSFKRAGQLKVHLSKKHSSQQEITSITNNAHFKSIDLKIRERQKYAVIQDGQKCGIAAVTPGIADTVSSTDRVQIVTDFKDLPGSYQIVEQLAQTADPPEQAQIIVETQSVRSPPIRSSEESVIHENNLQNTFIINADGDATINEQQMTLQTAKILSEIQSQLQQARSKEEGQPVQVEYEIIHDDENQQIVQIHYRDIENSPPNNVEPTEDLVVPGVQTVPDQTQLWLQEAEHEQEVVIAQVTDAINAGLQDVGTTSGLHENIIEDARPEFTAEVTTTTPAMHTVSLPPETDPNYQRDSEEVMQHEQVLQKTVSQLHPVPLQCETQLESDETQLTDHQTNENPSLEEQILSPLVQHDPKGTAFEYVSAPDFNSQSYYNWLSNFTELCLLVPMPLSVDLFQKISQVHKTLSDVLALPSGVLSEKENFRTLMNISQKLNGILNHHLTYVLENLDSKF